MADDDESAVGAAPSCFFNIRNRAGLFLNNRLTCVAECLERILVVSGVMFDAIKILFACRPTAGVLFVTNLTAPKRDISLEVSINYYVLLTSDQLLCCTMRLLLVKAFLLQQLVDQVVVIVW